MSERNSHVFINGHLVPQKMLNVKCNRWLLLHNINFDGGSFVSIEVFIPQLIIVSVSGGFLILSVVSYFMTYCARQITSSANSTAILL